MITKEDALKQAETELEAALRKKRLAQHMLTEADSEIEEAAKKIKKLSYKKYRKLGL